MGGGHPSIHENVAAGDEPAVRTHEQGADRSHFVRGAGAACGGRLDHAPVSRAAWPGQLVFGERGNDNAGADRVDPGAALAPAHRLGHDAQRVATLGELVGVQGVRHLAGLEEGKAEQLLDGRRGQRFVLFDGERGQAVPGLRRDDDPRAAAGDDVAELLQHEGRAVQVNLEDRYRRRLRGGHPGGMDQSGDLAQARRRPDERLHGLTRGHVHRGRAHLVSGVPQDLGCHVGVLLPHVRQQDMLADADPARDGLADLTGANDDDDILHGCSPCDCLLFRTLAIRFV